MSYVPPGFDHYPCKNKQQKQEQNTHVTTISIRSLSKLFQAPVNNNTILLVAR